MKTSRTRSAEAARELEAELDLYPDERGEILLEAAHSWRQAGDHDRAIELLTEAIHLGDHDGGNARVALAEILFDLDRGDEAQAQFDALRQERPASPTPYHLAAELLEERSEYQQALAWFNMAVSRLTDEEMTNRHDSRTMSYADHVVIGRRRVRQTLGLPADELDESVISVRDLPPYPADARLPHEAQVLFWPRDEIVPAHELWPQIVQHADTDMVMRDREAANRELSEAGIAQITMVPLTTARLTEFAARTGGDPADEKTRLACIDEIVAEGGVITWPPARNARCWCGSHIKYKKCCGRPNLA